MAFESDELLYGEQPRMRLPQEAKPSNADTDDYSTLRAIRDELAASLADLDKWHAFDLEEKNGMTIKQQIKAHELAYSIVSPLYDTVQSALEAVNRKYRNQ